MQKKKISFVFMYIYIFIYLFSDIITGPAQMMSRRRFANVINEAMALLSHLILSLDNEDQTWVLGKLTMLLLHHNEHIRKQSTNLYNLDGM